MIGAIAIVLAAMYMLRLISAVLHRERGGLVTDAALDLRPAEIGVIVPLVACPARALGLAGGDHRPLVPTGLSLASGGRKAAQVSCTEIPTQPRINKCMTLPDVDRQPRA